MMTSRQRPESSATRSAGARPRRARSQRPPSARSDLHQRAYRFGVDHLDNRQLVALIVEGVDGIETVERTEGGIEGIEFVEGGIERIERIETFEGIEGIDGGGGRDETDRGRRRVDERVARLFERAGGLLGLASRGVGSLAGELGLGLASAARLVAAIELGVRIAALARDPSLDAATCSADVAHWARARLAMLPHEELWALLLDSRNRIVGERIIARGGLHAMAVTASDVLRPIVREAASAFVLVHNHPGGDPCPSREDVAFTRSITLGAHTLGISLIDHVVVARDASISMLEAGLLDTLE